MSRELLEECKQAILANLQKWQYKDEVALYNILQKIETELANPDPDADAYLTIDSAGKHHVHIGKMQDSTMKDWNIIAQYKLYTSPPPHKPLSNDEIIDVCMTKLGWSVVEDLAFKFARAIEAAHGIK